MDQDEIESVLLEYTIKDIKNLIVEYIGATLVPNIDYDKSIQILKEIESQFTNKNIRDSCTQPVKDSRMFEDSPKTVKELYYSMYDNYNYNVDDVYSQQRHKLSIITLKIDNCYECYGRDWEELSICPPQIMDLFDRKRGFVEIYNEHGPVFDFSENNKWFSVMIRLHNTSFGENVARISFEYFDKLHAWIMTEHSMEFTGVIDDDDEFLLLDFSRYK